MTIPRNLPLCPLTWLIQWPSQAPLMSSGTGWAAALFQSRWNVEHPDANAASISSNNPDSNVGLVRSRISIGSFIGLKT